MKLRQEQISEAEIIFGDEEMKPIMMKLIEMAQGKNYKMSYVCKAISMTWHEKESEKHLLQPTDEEELFWKKVDNFIEKYRENILGAFDTNYTFAENPQQYFLEGLRQTLCIAYVVFEREESITQKHIERYAKEMFDKEKNVVANQFSKSFLFGKLHIPEEDQTGKISFYDFYSQFEYRRTTLMNNFMEFIWFIDTYC